MYESHFDKRMYDKSTDICVGARVAISNVNILPEVGLYNGAIGTVVEIVSTGQKDQMIRNTRYGAGQGGPLGNIPFRPFTSYCLVTSDFSFVS